MGTVAHDRDRVIVEVTRLHKAQCVGNGQSSSFLSQPELLSLSLGPQGAWASVPCLPQLCKHSWVSCYPGAGNKPK